jgi:hypothetical protein
MPLNRRGVSLVEAVVAAVLTAVLVVSALAGLALLQRAVSRFTGRALSDQSLRGTAQLLRSELRDLSPAAGELLSFGAGSIIYRAVRGSGRACGSSSGRILVSADSWSPLRQPVAGRDSLVLLGQPRDTELVVAAAGPVSAAVCPDGVASVALPYAVQVPDPVPGAAFQAPVLLSEVMEIRGYESGGQWWVGVRSLSAGETIQPAYGPIAPGGFSVIGLDSAGASTLVPSRVSHLVFTVLGPGGDSLDVRFDYSRGVWR